MFSDICDEALFFDWLLGDRRFHRFLPQGPLPHGRQSSAVERRCGAYGVSCARHALCAPWIVGAARAHGKGVGVTAFSYQLYSSRHFPPLADDTLTMLTMLANEADAVLAITRGFGV